MQELRAALHVAATGGALLTPTLHNSQLLPLFTSRGRGEAQAVPHGPAYAYITSKAAMHDE